MDTNKNLSAAIKRWISEDSVQEAKETYPRLISTYGCSSVISELARNYWLQQKRIIERIDPSAPSFTYHKPVRTLGVYYYRMRNGGIERVISLLLPVWIELGYKVVLITEEPASKDDYPIPLNVERLLLPKISECREANYHIRASAWNDIITSHKIDTVIYEAWDSAFLFWDACMLKGLGCNLISGIHGTYTYLFREQVPHRFNLFRAYRFIDCAVVLSHAFECFWNFYCPTFYIPNPIKICAQSDRSQLDGCTILWVGRIIEEKRPLDAIRAFALVKKKIPSSSLIMLGTGELNVLKRTNELISELNLTDDVILPGYQTDVSQYYKEATVLLFTSAFEGFPMTIAEAKSHGVPIVLYDLPYCEMINDRRGIISVPQEDIPGLAQALCDFLSAPLETRRAHGEAARKSAEDFAAFDLKEAWGKLFDRLTHPIQRSASIPQLDLDFLMDNIEFGEQKTANYLSDVLAGKAWLESHSQAQENWIGELQAAKDRAEASIKEKDQWLNELQAGKDWLEQQRLIHLDLIKELREEKVKLESNCHAQESKLNELKQEMGNVLAENERLRHFGGWIRCQLTKVFCKLPFNHN